MKEKKKSSQNQYLIQNHLKIQVFGLFEGSFFSSLYTDSNLDFLFKDYEEKEESLEETDILELTTGIPSDKKKKLEQSNKHKQIEKNQNLKQQVKFFFLFN